MSEKELEELIVERAKNVVRQMRDGGGNEVSLPINGRMRFIYNSRLIIKEAPFI